MSSKGKKKVASVLGIKRSRKGVAARSSCQEDPNLPPLKFDEQAVIQYVTDWYKDHKESKYLGDEYVEEDKLCREFPKIHAKISTLGLQYVCCESW